MCIAFVCVSVIGFVEDTESHCETSDKAAQSFNLGKRKKKRKSESVVYKKGNVNHFLRRGACGSFELGDAAVAPHPLSCQHEVTASECVFCFCFITLRDEVVFPRVRKLGI